MVKNLIQPKIFLNRRLYQFEWHGIYTVYRLLNVGNGMDTMQQHTLVHMRLIFIQCYNFHFLVKIAFHRRPFTSLSVHLVTSQFTINLIVLQVRREDDNLLVILIRMVSQNSSKCVLYANM